MRILLSLSVAATSSLLACENSASNVATPAANTATQPIAPSAEPPANVTTTDESDSNMTTITSGIDEEFAKTYVGRNHLADSTSPYLLQHQHNPVHWNEWGEEAFETARKLDRPILLSIGYSTCYWCHVMERESFEQDDVAQVINDSFVAIKVDREERPDVDEIYMTSCQIYTQMTTGQPRGGWPLTVLLEPHTLKPFFAGTYYPKGQFVGLLNQVTTVWRDNRAGIMQDSANLARVIEAQFSEVPTAVELNAENIERAVTTMLAGYDSVHGGFRQGGPKFPMPTQIDMMLAAGWDLSSVRDAVTHTLNRMATGGMYDQVGGGFHRYSVDEKWLVPHFEKMLYDNGQLAATYARAYELTDDAYFAEIVRETCDYVLREMRDQAGGFWSAQDAEVNHREGENYLWTVEQMETVLRDAGMEDQVDFAKQIYGLDQGTNFTDPHHPEDGPKNVLYLVDVPSTLAGRFDLNVDDFNQRVETVNAVLYEARQTRDQPITDDKVLASWNGLMIAGLAEGGRVLDDSKYIEAAHEAAEFVLTTMRADDGGLLHTYRDGEARIDGLLEDYAMMIRGLVALHRATDDAWPLEQALELLTEANERFFDETTGFYYDTQPGQSDLFVRTRSMFDGALPAGNTTMALNLVDLHALTDDGSYQRQAVRVFELLSAAIAERATGVPVGVIALHRSLGDAEEPVTVATTETAPQPKPPLPPSAYDRQEKVSVKTSPNLLRLAEGATEEFTLTITIARGYHINAHQPGQEMLIPFDLKLVGGEGLELIVEFPDGERYDGPAGNANVHHGTVSIPVKVRRTSEISGRPEIVITYQACDNRQCLMPVTEPLPVRFRAE